MDFDGSAGPLNGAGRTLPRSLNIRAVQVHELFDQSLIAIFGTTAGPILVVIAMWEVVSHVWLLAWLCLTVVIQVGRYWLVRSYFRAAPSATEIDFWRRWFILGVLVSALLWGIAGVAFFPAQSLSHQFFLALFVIGVGCGTAAVHWSMKEVCIPAVLIEMLPLTGRFVYEGEGVHLLFGLANMAFVAIILMAVNRANIGYLSRLKLQFENADLVASLETARRDLERRVDGRTAELARANEDLRREISERKAMETALRDSEEKYRALVDRAPIGILSVDTEGRILEANQKLLEILGSPGPEATKEINMFTFPLLVEAGISDEFMRCQQEERPVTAERPYVSKWGKQVYLRMLLAPLRNSQGGLLGCQAVMEDISEQKHAEAELIASEEKLRVIINSSPIGIGIGLDRRYVYANPAFVRLFGYEDANEIIGMPIGSFAVPDDAARIRELMSGVVAGKIREPHFQVTNVRKDGSKWSGEGWITSIQYEGKPAVLLFTMDVTEARSLRTQLLHSQKMEAIGTLAGGIAHDFNNLLAVVLGYSELLLTDKASDDPEYEDLKRISDTARNGADLVQRLLTFSRKVETRPRPLNLNSVVRQAEQILRRTMPRIIELELDLQTDLRIVNADAGQVEQVLLNLALNAKDAMPSGGRLVIQTENVTAGDEFRKTHLGAAPGDYVTLKISDTGHGIEERVLEHIFEPFYTTKGPGEGSGLGLAMVYGIVAGHGGYIECQSSPGRGTTFLMYFPVLQVKEVPRAAVPKSQAPGGKETILLVDDEDFIRELGRRILSRVGYTVLVASNGREALDVYRKRRNEIKLIILDLIMPIMEGAQCMDLLVEEDPEVKVLIATGHWPTGAVRAALEVKAKGFVSKPYDINQLLNEVRKVLDSP